MRGGGYYFFFTISRCTQGRIQELSKEGAGIPPNGERGDPRAVPPLSRSGRGGERRVPGLLAPETFRSRERKVHVDNFRSLEISLLGKFVPKELSHPGNFTIPNFPKNK